MAKNQKEAKVSQQRVFNSRFNPAMLGGQINNEPSLTKPDDTMTIVEMFDVYGSGSLIDNIGKKMYYDGIGNEVDITDDYLAGQHWEQLDLVEQHEILKKVEHDYTRLNAGIAAAQKEKAKLFEDERKIKMQREAEIDEFIKSKRDKVQPTG